MSAKTCDKCPYYLRRSGYCALLGVKVKDPLKPPCSADSGNSKGAEPAASVVPMQGSATVVSDAVAVAPTAPPAPSQIAAAQQAQQQSLAQIETSAVAQVPAGYDIEPHEQFLEPGSFDYASTGIPELDRALGGGFIRGKTYLVAGETGAGKTIFSLQFLLTGALYYNEPGVYIAIDEPTDQLLKGLKRFGWDVAELVKSRMLTFLDMRTHFSKIYLREERKKIEPRFIIESVLNAVKKAKAKRLVIDPIAPLIYGGSSEDVLYVREFLREMVFAIERVGTITTVMTSEVPTGSKMLSRFGVEEFLASGIIVLGLEEVGGSVVRVMYLRKARWAPAKPVKFIFDIEPGRGIVVKGLYSLQEVPSP
jgi:circadian clock protein KaiC